jgi:D-alanyl-D-alanine carboxypeptidase
MISARTRVRLVGPLVAVLLAIAAALTTVTAAQASTDMSRDLRENLTQYLAAHAADEHVSAVSLSVSFPGRRNSLNVSAGTMTFGGSRPVYQTLTENHLV